MSALEMERQEATSFAVVQELQRELEKQVQCRENPGRLRFEFCKFSQANIIFRLRQDNVTLRCKLDSERGEKLHEMSARRGRVFVCRDVPVLR